MKFADLFAGIGGFHYAIKEIIPNAEPVLVSEIDKFAKEVYSLNHNFPIKEIRNIRDFTENGDEGRQLLNKIDDFEILFGGFPCQSFSNAGNKAGFLDKTRGTLFYDVAKLLKIKKPKYILLENVKYLASHDNGKTWITIKEILNGLGYIIPDKPLLLSPNEFGIPQFRPRIFIPGILRSKTKIKKISCDLFFFNKKNEVKQLEFDEEIDEITIIKDKKILNALEAWGEFIKNVERPNGRTLPVIWLDHMNNKKISLDLKSEWEKKYIKDMKEVYKKNKEFIDFWMKKHKVHNWQKRERKLEWQAGAENYDYKNAYVQLRQSGVRFRKIGIFPTLVAIVQIPIFFDFKINKWRYLSKREVTKLQSFPSTFKFNNIPEFQSYKQFGNSVNVIVAREVLRKLLEIGDIE